MKRFSAIILCFLLLYAGAAWAIEACLHPDGHHMHHAASVHDEPHHGEQLPSNDSGSSGPSLPTLHCPDLSFEVGLPVLAFSLVPFPDQAPVGRSLVTGSELTDGTADLWLRGLFKRYLSFSFLSGLPLHLFLSVLRI